jgi:hypothetical protein
MAKQTEFDNLRRRFLEAICGALIGVAIVSVIELLGLPNLDRALTVALYCFAISIPSLTYYMMTVLLDAAAERASRYPLYNAMAFFIGILASLTGVASLFVHFSYKLGLLFIVLCLLGFYGQKLYDKDMKE